MLLENGSSMVVDTSRPVVAGEAEDSSSSSSSSSEDSEGEQGEREDSSTHPLRSVPFSRLSCKRLALPNPLVTEYNPQCVCVLSLVAH